MAEKRYSVFISSTFEDLRLERQAVQDAILNAGDFPVQMESFPAADVGQFDFIKSLIDKCDYYVLIIAGRYGTLADDGVSYTEKEYLYAKSKNIPILVMLHGDPGKITSENTEMTDAGKKRLERFKEEVLSGRLRARWTSTGELKHVVRDALDHAKATTPGVGWVRGDAVASQELLSEINELRKDNEKLRETAGLLNSELTLPPLPEATETLEIDLIPLIVRSLYGRASSGTYAKIRCSWIDAFPVFYSALKWGANDWSGEEEYYTDEDESRRAIGAAFAAELANFDTQGLFTISSNAFERLMSYYIEVGLMFARGEQPFTEFGKMHARRHRISSAGSNSFLIVKGEVGIKNELSAVANSDDEIPF